MFPGDDEAWAGPGWAGQCVAGAGARRGMNVERAAGASQGEALQVKVRACFSSWHQ